MARIETWFDCDLRKTVEVVPLKGHLYSGDDNANLFGVHVIKDGMPFPVSGTLMCYGMRDDGVTVITRNNVTDTSNPSVELEHDFYDVIGPIQIVLRLVSGNDQTVLAACNTYVVKTTSATLIDGGQTIPSLETLIARMDDCERAANAANNAASAAQTKVSAAQTAAQNAQTAASQANIRAEAAETAATNAQASASNAATDAANAQLAVQSIQTATSQANARASAAETAANNASTAASAAQTAAENAATSASSAATQASNANSAAAQSRSSADAAQTSALNAATSAANAAANADNANTSAQAANALANRLSATFSELLPGLVDGAKVENDALYLLHGTDVVAGPFSGFGGGGGGGGSSTNLRFTFASTDGNYYIVSNLGGQVVLDLTWLCEEDGEPTGNGTLKLTIDGLQKFNKTVPQGRIFEDVSQYLREGDNTLQFTMMNSYGNTRARTFTIVVYNLQITSSFDGSAVQYGDIAFPYMPYGNVQKTVHFLIDGIEAINPVTVSGYGRQITQILPAQSHGSHTLEVYYTSELNGSTVYSNRLRYEISCVDLDYDDPIITVNYDGDLTINQYGTVNFQWMVYTPTSQTSNVEFYLNGTLISELVNIDRSAQVFSYRIDTAGTATIRIVSGTAIKTLTVTVNAVSIDAEAETEGLKLYLNSYGRNNNESNPAVWTYIDQNDSIIAATFTDFNWVSDGWQLDEDNISVMRVSGDARITIPYKPFATDKRSTGFTVEIDFRTRDVRNYDSPILSCMYNGRGFRLTSQRFELDSESSGMYMQFKEDEHIRASFVVEKQSEHRLIYCYINGIMSGVTQYPAGDMENFAQAIPQNISIGSNDATIDLYTIRIYDYDLPMKQVEANWIVDSATSEEMLSRYGRNNVRNESDEIVISKLPSDLPYMIIVAEVLPQYKGDKKTCSGVYTDPINSENSFTFENCEIDVQGTSSQYYARKNYKMKFNGGFTMSSGSTESKYKLRSDSIPVKTFCMKADVASSEGANNVELVRLYESACPYKTPAQVENSKVRQGIDGFPIVIFWNNPINNETTFLGKYNFNNDKSTEDVFGFVEGDESWEIRNNTNNYVLWRTDDYEAMGLDDDGNVVPAWTNNFEARYPDTKPPYQNPAQLKELATFLKSTDPTQATNDALSEAVSYPSRRATTIQIVDPETGAISYTEAYENVTVTYTTDSAEYRKAKFKNEIGNYVEIQSALFYYLFTELFLMVDSRAKNAFPSFMGTAIGGNEE